MDSFKSLCEKYFGSSNFYEILKIDPGASDIEIKKAYHRLSRIVHPDRVNESQKKIATEKFKVLGKIHSILQNKEERRIYDCELGEEINNSFNWTDYLPTKLFTMIDLLDNINYEKTYIGSEKELRDIKRAYVESRGNMDIILKMVPFTDCDSEPRIIEIVQKLVDNGEVEMYNNFFNESKQKTLRRHAKWEKEYQEYKQRILEKIKMEAEGKKERDTAFAFMLSYLVEKYAQTKNKKRVIGGKLAARKRKITKKYF